MLVQNWVFWGFFNFHYPQWGLQARPGGLALQRARGPRPQLGHIPPPPHLSCSPGPMEGQAVPNEPCPGCALTPTIHANPPLHPLQLLSPLSPGSSARKLQPCAHPAQGTVSSPSEELGAGPGPSRAQAMGWAPATQMRSPAQPLALTRPFPHPCPLLWDLLLGEVGLGTWTT